MGLLSRASNVDLSEHAPLEPEVILDDMGQALRERIGRLETEPGSANTVLSLLKAYGAFQTGICLILKEKTYSSVTSLGLKTGKLSIPLESIWSIEKAGSNYFKLDPGEKVGITNAEENLDYWAFPLRNRNADPAKPWDGIMILGIGESPGSSSVFDPGSVSAVLSGNEDKILVKREQEPDGVDTAEEETDESGFQEYNSADDFLREKNNERDSVKEKIAQFHLNHSTINCIILEIPASAAAGDKDDFCRKVTDMISLTGTVIPLPSGSPLILLSDKSDRELIAHRLSHSFSTKPIISFEADDPENVCRQISSLL